MGRQRTPTDASEAAATLGLPIPYGHQQIPSLSTSAAQTLTPPAGARIALIQVEGGDLRWRDDATSPTSNVGMRLYNGDTLPYTGLLSAIQLIAVSAGVIVNINYYG